MQFNKVIIAGNLTRGAEVLYTPKGMAYVNLRMAVNRKFKNKLGEIKEETVYLTVVAWDKLAESCKTLTKGFPIFVEGSLSQREYEKEGIKHQVIEVRAETIKFLKNPNEGVVTNNIESPETVTGEPNAEA
jgi:single-strand DNA-binding protein